MMNAADVILDDVTIPFDWDFATCPSSDTDHSISPSPLTTVSPFDYLIHKPHDRIRTNTSANTNTPLSGLSTIFESSVLTKIDISLEPPTLELDLLCQESFVYKAPDNKECYPHGLSNAGSIGNHQTKRRQKAPKSYVSRGQHCSLLRVDLQQGKESLPSVCAGSHQDSVTVKRARKNLATQKSRSRNIQYLQGLQKQILELEIERDYWKGIALSKSLQLV
ncbi:Ff.00g100650.m01.CDS01 [Fusarium sp. VM40]|nr:Ff.00g100650.m01.CDS01 [Fusarium sp. VM40]